MIVIGLTGGIATGKSTVAAFLRELGLPVVDADELARQVVEPGEPALAELARAFGPDILLENGHLDRKKLGALIFEDPAARSRLNDITHPHILRLLDSRRREAETRGEEILIMDVPLLFESGLDRSVDRTWVVAVPESLQIQRLMGRDGLTEEEARSRVAAQLPLVAKIGRADAVIDNSGSRESTRSRVRYLLESLPRTAGGAE